MPSTPPEGYLFDMRAAARKIERVLEGYDLAQFRRDETTISAVERQFILLGEAVKRVNPAFRIWSLEINFRLANLMWNLVVHHYDQVHLDRLWEIAKEGCTRIEHFNGGGQRPRKSVQEVSKQLSGRLAFHVVSPSA